MKAKICVDSDGKFYGIRFECPGCALGGSGYKVLPVDWTPQGYQRTDKPLSDSWGFNGDMERPTFTPSVLTRSQRWTPPVGETNLAEWKAAPWPQNKVDHVCHSFVKDGRIQFLDDCTHALAGQTVDLPEIDDD